MDLVSEPYVTHRLGKGKQGGLGLPCSKSRTISDLQTCQETSCSQDAYFKEQTVIFMKVLLLHVKVFAEEKPKYIL